MQKALQKNFVENFHKITELHGSTERGWAGVKSHGISRPVTQIRCHFAPRGACPGAASAVGNPGRRPFDSINMAPVSSQETARQVRMGDASKKGIHPERSAPESRADCFNIPGQESQGGRGTMGFCHQRPFHVGQATRILFLPAHRGHRSAPSNSKPRTLHQTERGLGKKKRLTNLRLRKPITRTAKRSNATVAKLEGGGPTAAYVFPPHFPAWRESNAVVFRLLLRPTGANSRGSLSEAVFTGGVIPASLHANFLVQLFPALGNSASWTTSPCRIFVPQRGAFRPNTKDCCTSKTPAKPHAQAFTDIAAVFQAKPGRSRKSLGGGR